MRELSVTPREFLDGASHAASGELLHGALHGCRGMPHVEDELGRGTTGTGFYLGLPLGQTPGVLVALLTAGGAREVANDAVRVASEVREGVPHAPAGQTARTPDRRVVEGLKGPVEGSLCSHAPLDPFGRSTVTGRLADHLSGHS